MELALAATSRLQFLEISWRPSMFLTIGLISPMVKDDVLVFLQKTYPCTERCNNQQWT